jgi:DNA-binding NarL/FixJ family response regulator
VRPIKILVVDDFERFRQFVCSTLQQRTEFQVVGQASDGLEAVRKAEELQPDLILLDIGLPKLNGIKAGSRIRALSPDSKILFISQDPSADVVEEALRLGARGYLHKSNAGGELLLAVETVLQGKQFVSSSLKRSESAHRLPSKELQAPQPSRNHEAVFYRDDASFVDVFTRFIEAALKGGNVVIVIVTEAHQRSLLQQLQTHGWDMAAAIQQGIYTSLDVSDTLSMLMVDDRPDSDRFVKVAGDLIRGATETAKGKHARIACCGEAAPTLWAQGNHEAAIQLEHLWDEIARSQDIDILCGYFLKDVWSKDNSDAFQRISAQHSDSHVY